MKASELIDELKMLIEKHGDLDVEVDYCRGIRAEFVKGDEDSDPIISISLR